MFRIGRVAGLGWLLFLGCSPASKKPLGKGPFDPKEYIDVNSHLVFESRDVMRTPYFMYRISLVNGRRDSAVVSSEEFARWQTFLFNHNMLAGDTGTWYRESTFGDTLTGFVTTTYSAEQPELPIRSISVLSSPESGFIKHVYVSKQYRAGDSTVLEKLGWNAGKSLMVNRSIQGAEGASRNEQTTLYWQ